MNQCFHPSELAGTSPAPWCCSQRDACTRTRLQIAEQPRLWLKHRSRRWDTARRAPSVHGEGTRAAPGAKRHQLSTDFMGQRGGGGQICCVCRGGGRLGVDPFLPAPPAPGLWDASKIPCISHPVPHPLAPLQTAQHHGRQCSAPAGSAVGCWRGAAWRQLSCSQPGGGPRTSQGDDLGAQRG